MNSYSSDPNYLEVDGSIEQQRVDKMRSQIKMEKQERDEFARKAEALLKVRDCIEE